MKTIQSTLLACAIISLCGAAFADERTATDEFHAAPGEAFSKGRGCSLRDIAGNWLFATGIGHQMLPGFPPDKDITALGTMEVRKDGTLSGTFDVTVQDSFFIPGIRYDGSVMINRDCTGTLTFVTEVGSVRTDSIALVGRGEIVGMSQDPANLWTYQARRVGYAGRRID